tara:strand:- start:4792 stop:4971 length:180 start_codon:yes stop_codon:yes gene_type:complete
MKTLARIIIDIEVDPEVYVMPVDNDIEEEMSDIIINTFYELEGIDIADVTTTQKIQRKK